MKDRDHGAAPDWAALELTVATVNYGSKAPVR
jgi:hypothetical protein